MHLPLKESTTVTELIFIKLMLARYQFLKISYTEFHENLTNDLVTETGSQTDDRHGPKIRCSFLYGKEHQKCNGPVGKLRGQEGHRKQVPTVALKYRHENTKHCTLQVHLFMYHIPHKYHPYRLPIHCVHLESDAVQSGTCTTALQNVLATISLQIHALQTTQQTLPQHTVQKYHNIHPCGLTHQFLNF